jgi:hypothetical protein
MKNVLRILFKKRRNYFTLYFNKGIVIAERKTHPKRGIFKSTAGDLGRRGKVPQTFYYFVPAKLLAGRSKKKYGSQVMNRRNFVYLNR